MSSQQILSPLYSRGASGGDRVVLSACVLCEIISQIPPVSHPSACIHSTRYVFTLQNNNEFIIIIIVNNNQPGDIAKVVCFGSHPAERHHRYPSKPREGRTLNILNIHSPIISPCLCISAPSISQTPFTAFTAPQAPS